MKIAIVNDIHIGEPLSHEGKVRAASHLARDVLPKILRDITEWHSPDLIVNLGDLIRCESKEKDTKSYREAMSVFQSLDAPVLHLLGNHELKHIGETSVESIWNEFGFSQKVFGIREYDQFSILWLGLEFVGGTFFRRALPKEQLLWLKETLKKANKPVFLFTHVPIDDQNMRGNFFYEAFCIPLNKTEGLFLENQREIREIIEESGVVEMVLQGHLHYYHANQIANVPYVTCPAMGDNLCAPGVENVFPEVYTILEVDKGHVTVKAYSRRYCFTGSQWPFTKLKTSI